MPIKFLPNRLFSKTFKYLPEKFNNLVLQDEAKTWLKSEAVQSWGHIRKLLIGRHSGVGLPEQGSLTFWILLLLFLFTSATKRIVGLADAGPIGALSIPLLTLAGAYAVAVVRRPCVVPAFMLIAIAVNLLLIASVTVGLEHRIYQWILVFWLYGASAYFAYTLPSSADSSKQY